jgi:cyclic pyranopterin phosphate synthase
MRAAIVERPLDAAALLAEVASHGHGATTLFVGTVRDVNDGRAVLGIEYTAYGAMAQRELDRILAEAAARFGGVALVIEHRIGYLALGEASVAVAAAHARRAPAMDAARYVVEEMKRRVPIWKREHYVDGTREWVDPSLPSGEPPSRDSGSARPRRGPRSRRARERRPGSPREERPMNAPVLRDQFGRSIEYLRISVTDRCNFRCVYCMPAAGLPWIPKPAILSYEEIGEVVRQLAALGLRRIRLTGGEPTVRRDLPSLVRLLRAIPGIDDIALSTNGVLLPSLAAPLREAGLDRVNISADSLRPERIAAIARRNLGFEPARAAAAAEAAGLGPVKINVVVMRGANDDEIGDFARLTVDHPWHVRFIELMPVGELAESLGDDALERVVPSAEVLDRAAEALGGLEPAGDAGPRGNGPAAYWRAPGAAGTIGVITPMTHTYCGSCNRVRLTADGRLRTCLFGDHEVTCAAPCARASRSSRTCAARWPGSRASTRCSSCGPAGCAPCRRWAGERGRADVGTGRADAQPRRCRGCGVDGGRGGEAGDRPRGARPRRGRDERGGARRRALERGQEG